MKRLPFKRPAPTASPKSSWEGVSDWYAGYLAKPNTLQQNIVFPKTLRLLDPKSGKKYLDIACGEGAFSRVIGKLPGVLIDGFDASPSLIERAKKHAPRNARYSVADATSFAPSFEQKAYDGACCILAIQNIESLSDVLRDASIVLKSGAPLVLVLNHPCYRQPKQSSWGWDDVHKIQYRRADRYLSPYESPILAHPGAAPTVKTFSYHRPLSTYVNELGRAGFQIDAMEEWVSDKISDSGPRAKAENAAREEIPLFLAIRARKN